MDKLKIPEQNSFLAPKIDLILIFVLSEHVRTNTVKTFILGKILEKCQIFAKIYFRVN
jgi:hypothetical protein